jgi:hypothetical protein
VNCVQQVCSQLLLAYTTWSKPSSRGRPEFQTFEGMEGLPSEANFSCPCAVNKKAVTYHKWCGSSESGPRGSPFSIPSYLLRIWTNFGDTETFLKECLKLCVCMLLQALNLFLSKLVITVSLILRSMHF